jgi:hypothetical protein
MSWVVAAWGGVVEVAADQHVALLSVALQLLGGPGPDGGGLGGPLVQGVQPKAGAYGLIAGVELGMLGVTAGEGQQLGLQMGGEGLHRQAVSAGEGDRKRPALGGGDRGDLVPVIVDCGRRHLMRIDSDIGGVRQLAAGQPAHASAARVGPLG